MAQNKIILGIDPGIADTGFGIVYQEGSRLACLEYGSIKTSAKKELPARLLELGTTLDALIKKHKPDVIAVEELYFCNNAKTALIVGQARGVVLYVAMQHNLPLKNFTPLQVKQAVSAYGKADKQQVQRMVKMILGLKEIPKPDDAADALAVAICGANN